MESNVTLTTTETSAPTKDETNYYLTIVSLCIGVINTVIVIGMIIWLRKHPKFRGSGDNLKKPKPASPKKILTIDYHMSELDDAIEYCPQRLGSFAIRQPAPQEGRRASTHAHHHGDRQDGDMDNPSFIAAAPEGLASVQVYENTRFPHRVT